MDEVDEGYAQSIMAKFEEAKIARISAIKAVLQDTNYPVDMGQVIRTHPETFSGYSFEEVEAMAFDLEKEGKVLHIPCSDCNLWMLAD